MSSKGSINQQIMKIDAYMNQDEVFNRFQSVLGENAQSFTASVIQVTNQSRKLKLADPQTIFTAALTAASLSLPIDPNLGFAYIIPYDINEKQPDGTWKKRVVAQFQMGYKGFIQLAQRSGQYQRINAVTVYENQYKGYNSLTEEIECDFTLKGVGKVAGYVGYFKLKNGFEKLLFVRYEDMREHANKYSKSISHKNSIWNDETGGADAMGMKTALKMVLSKYGPLSVDSAMQKAIKADQSVQTEEGQYSYVDNPEESKSIEEKQFDDEKQRLLVAIDKAKNKADLDKLAKYVDHYQCDQEFDEKMLIVQNQEK